jgi:deoxyribodipyrimidine photo-lyase
LLRVLAHEEWTPRRLGKKTGGKRTGWWGMSPGAEAWLDELVTWRELGYNMAARERNYDQYESLPDWARTTLERHAGDRRPHVYSLDEFAAAKTHDDLWNAAQTQLVREGRIHNYLRMLWGKKILEWSATPRDALAVMIELNNRYALDGRDPSSYSGIFWVLGRYDRAWGPEREVFGKIRYMSSENTRRKLRVEAYCDRWEG